MRHVRFRVEALRNLVKKGMGIHLFTTRRGASAWRVLHAAQQGGKLATTGAYTHVRHPQYDGFILIMLGFLIQWPTISTLVMFPILVYTYARLSRREEEEVRARFGSEWDRYASETPAFIPRLRRHIQDIEHHRGSAGV
jgi:protein-S-isoprenylcysteine O-methyltransferase Ste14